MVNTKRDAKGLHAAVTDNILFRSDILLLLLLLLVLTLIRLFKQQILNHRIMIDVFISMHISCE